MTGACETALAPGVAAYQQLTDAGKFCDLADLDDNLATICRGATGEARNQALENADKKILCSVLCCCSRNPVLSASGRNGYQTCASQTLSAAEGFMGQDSRFKPEVSFNMRTVPPTPLMERGLRVLGIGGGLTTTRIPNTPGGNRHMANRVGQTGDGSPFEPGVGDIRRPDEVIVRDPNRPPTQDNISRVVEMKFPGDCFPDEQQTAYELIGGIAPLLLDVDACDCNNDDETQRMTQLVTAAQSVRENERSRLARIGWGALGTVAALGAVALALVPFDGPAGEIAAGTGSAAAFARAFAAAGWSAQRLSAAAALASQRWTTLFARPAAGF